MDYDTLVEIVSAKVHEDWMCWSKNIAATERISEERRDRWEDAWIPYVDLPESVKEQDRVFARRIVNEIYHYLKE